MNKKISLKRKSVMGLLLLAFIIAATAVTVSYKVYSQTMDTHYISLTRDISETAAEVIDKEQVQYLANQVSQIYLKNPCPDLSDAHVAEDYYKQYDVVSGADYESVYNRLSKLKDLNEVYSLYLIYVDAPSKSCVYIVDGYDEYQ